MNQKERKKTVEDNRKKYNIIGGKAYQFPTKNAIYLSAGNKINHELSKALGGIMCLKWGDIKWNDQIKSLLTRLEKEVNILMCQFPKVKSDFITECIPKSDKARRIDLVILNGEHWVEWENKSKIKKEKAITIYI